MYNQINNNTHSLFTICYIIHGHSSISTRTELLSIPQYALQTSHGRWQRDACISSTHFSNSHDASATNRARTINLYAKPIAHVDARPYREKHMHTHTTTLTRTSRTQINTRTGAIGADVCKYIFEYVIERARRMQPVPPAPLCQITIIHMHIRSAWETGTR